MHQFLSEMIFMSEEKLVPKLRFKGFDDEWVIKRLDEISEINPKTRELPENFVYIDLDSVNNGILTKFNKINKIDAPSRAQRCLDLNDILFQTVRPYQMNNFFFELNDCDYVASTGYAQIKSQIFPRFLYYYLHYYKFVNDVLNRCTGSSYPAINSTDLKKIKIKIPSSFNEQKLIGDLFHKIDKKIELLENKYEYYQYFKKYLMQQIFTQKLRFDFNDEWKNIPFKKLLKEVNEKTTVNNQHEILSSTKEGIFTQKDYFADRNVASKDNTGYKVLRKNQIVLSPQNLWMGNINVNTEFDIGIVSPSYKIYETTDLIDINYFKHIVKLPRLIYEYTCASEQGASIVRRNLNKQLFNEITIKVPSLNEQKKIGNLFDTCDEKIKNIDKNIQDMKEFKKGLLQQMFV